jgi:hypothetical protein
MSTPAVHRTVQRTIHAAATPAEVFPLLCPVREHEWIDGWQAEVLHSTSGLAELGCVFIAYPATQRLVFVITRHEKDRAVEFAIFHGHTAERLSITLAPAAGGTDMVWTRSYTALNKEGAAWIEANVPVQAEARVAGLEGMMARYLAKQRGQI